MPSASRCAESGTGASYSRLQHEHVLLELAHLAAHAHVEVRLGGLDVVVQVVADTSRSPKASSMMGFFGPINMPSGTCCFEPIFLVGDGAARSSVWLLVSGDLGPVSRVAGRGGGEASASGDGHWLGRVLIRRVEATSPRAVKKMRS